MDSSHLISLYSPFGSISTQSTYANSAQVPFKPRKLFENSVHVLDLRIVKQLSDTRRLVYPHAEKLLSARQGRLCYYISLYPGNHRAHSSNIHEISL